MYLFFFSTPVSSMYHSNPKSYCLRTIERFSTILVPNGGLHVITSYFSAYFFYVFKRVIFYNIGLSITVQKHIQHCHLNGVRRIINTPDTICKSRIKLSCGSKCSDEEICTTTSWVCNMFTELRIDNINKEIRNRSWCEILRHIPLIQSLRKLHIKGLNYISLRMNNLYRS